MAAVQVHIIDILLQAEAIQYTDDWRYTDDEMYIRTYTSDAYRHLTKWYSASETYMYIPPETKALKCGTEHELDVYFNAEEGRTYTLVAMVSYRGRVGNTS